MAKLDKDQVIASFTEAYTKHHGKAPKIEAKGGWYSVDGAKNVRLADLNSQISGFTAKPPKDVSKSSQSIKKTASNVKAKKAPSTFSVKQYWAEKIAQTNPGVKAPR